MAAAAAEHLLRRHKDSDAPPTSLLLPFEIVVRESTGIPAIKPSVAKRSNSYRIEKSGGET
jgi:hypothetical protein